MEVLLCKHWGVRMVSFNDSLGTSQSNNAVTATGWLASMVSLIFVLMVALIFRLLDNGYEVIFNRFDSSCCVACFAPERA